MRNIKNNMRKILLVCGMFFSQHLFSQPVLQWAKSIGGANTFATGCSIATDTIGNIYTAGYFNATVDFDAGIGVYNLSAKGFTEDIFITKLDPFGNFIWAKVIGGLGVDRPRSIATDNLGNIYITGDFLSDTIDFDPGMGVHNITSFGACDIFIVKLDASGNFIWAKTVGGSGFETGNFIKADAVGNIYVTGYFDGIVDFDPGLNVFNLISSPGNATVFVSKLDANGNFIWAKAIGGPDIDLATSLCVNSNGDVYVTGYFQLTTDFDPDTATFNLTSMGNADIFILKLSNSGNFLWAKALGGNDYDLGHSINIDSAGNIYTTGDFRGTVDFDPGAGYFDITAVGSNDIFVLKLDSLGNFIWVKSINGAAGESGNSISTDAMGNTYTAGWFTGPVDFNPNQGTCIINSNGLQDVYILKLDVNGNLLCVSTIGGTGNDIAYSIAADNNGNMYTTGYFSATADFDADPSVQFNLSSTGASDVFISKFSQACLNIGLNDYTNFTNNFNAYPNPTSSILNFLNEYPYFLNATIEIKNTLGQVVSTIPYSKTIDVSSLNQGMYFITVTANNNAIILKDKFIKN